MPGCLELAEGQSKRLPEIRKGFAVETPVYFVNTCGQPEVFRVTNLRPEGASAPRTEGSMRYTPGAGFEAILRCYEEDPLITYYQPDGFVYHDSCMEVFLNCFPELPEAKYLNVEMNAAGTALCAFGTTEERSFLLQLGLQQPEITPTRGRDESGSYWQLQCFIPESLLETLYQRPCRFAPGDQLRGNFYKCGDKTAAPHWASWSPVSVLNFHIPEDFGILEIR